MIPPMPSLAIPALPTPPAVRRLSWIIGILLLTSTAACAPTLASSPSEPRTKETHPPGEQAPVARDRIISPNVLPVRLKPAEPTQPVKKKSPPRLKVVEIREPDYAATDYAATNYESSNYEATNYEATSYEASPRTSYITKTDYIIFDFPVVVNQRVQFFLNRFQNELRPTFSRWLARSSRYVPMIRENLREAGLPQDLAFLPMIESGFVPVAVSPAGAVGPWQFMAPTARQYGLAINDYVDYRRDPIRSTQAAIAFLGDLYREFGCWFVATAAYNAGGGRLRGAIRRFNTDDFWEISQHNHLAQETRNFVPKLIATIIIARDPEAFGFTNITFEEELRYETIEVPRRTSLEAVALAGDINLEELRKLNRQLRHLITPPNQATYTLRLPKGKGQVVASKLPRVRAVTQTEYRNHLVRRGETLNQISRDNRLNKNVLIRANSLRSERLVAGQQLRIPVQKTAFKLLPEEAELKASSSQTELIADSSQPKTSAQGLTLHVIQAGESLGLIAQRYGVSATELAAWNNITEPNRIRVGQQLVLFPPPPRPERVQELVIAGPLPGASSQEAKTRPERVQELVIAGVAKRVPTAEPAANQAPPTTTTYKVRAGVAKRAPTARLAANQASPTTTTYKVRAGDTLWSIANKFQTTTRMLRKWNQLSDDLIRPGKRLTIHLAER